LSVVGVPDSIGAHVTTEIFAHFLPRTRGPEIIQGRFMALKIDYRRRHNARRYILRLNENGDGGCVTIPRSGSWDEARRFARRNVPWLEERLQRWREKAKSALPENQILFRGEPVATETLIALFPNSQGASAKSILWALARNELPPRVNELAAVHGLAVKRVSVRDQRSRWGSCSVKGVISLNWRLVQTPEFVRDYIIVHELMHLREMNHSDRFWNLVYAAFPRTNEAERWLKSHGTMLRSR